MTTDSPFRLTVEDVFSIRGRGTVAIGTIESGSIRLGATVQFTHNGASQQARVTGLEALHKIISQAGTGETVGILLAGIEPKDIQRGDVLTGS